MKKQIQNLIRKFHLTYFLNQQLPVNIALYFHSLEGLSIINFKEMISYFNSLGYVFVTPEEFTVDGDKKILLSFDDNYYDWYTTLPLFEQINIKCTFFINSVTIDSYQQLIIDKYYDRISHCGSRIPLKSTEIKAIYDSGHCIGGHTHSHYNLAKISYALATEEIKINKEILQSIIKNEIYYFSYPFGMRRHFNAKLEKFCHQIGYKRIFTAIAGRQYEISRNHRTPWLLNMDLDYNISNLKINGMIFEGITHRSPIG